MAIALATSQINGSAAPASPLAVTITINAGETAVLFLAAGGAVPTVTSITGGGTWTKRGATITLANHSIQCWSTDAGAAAAAASVSVAYTGAPASTVLVVHTTTGVLGIGNLATASANSTTPSVSLTTQDPNNWAVGALVYDDGSVADPGGGSGTQRQVLAEVAATDTYLFLKDNTAASPGAVVNSKGAFGAAGNWVASALELRTVAGGAPIPLLGNLFVGPIGFGR